jgi:hypothetical protein
MPDCQQKFRNFPSFDRRIIETNFDGGNVSSDGGLMLLRQADRRLGLINALDKALVDPRKAEQITHSQADLLRQRIFGIALGYEDLNDHDTLREDLVWQTAVDRDTPLASSPTLCRLENRTDRDAAVQFHKVMVEAFIASHKTAPEELVLDFDATDDRVHGQQQGRSFHGYYGNWCFLPLYVFCGEQLLVSYLRPSNIDAAKHSRAVLALLVKRMRKAWPAVQIVFRADSGFCRWKTLRWCERHGVGYVVGLAKNKRLNVLSASLQANALEGFQSSGQKQRLFCEFEYKAGTWDCKRRVIAKAEHTDKGANPRYIVTNLGHDGQALYDKVYCARGEMENRIKEQQLGLFADRTSCAQWWANQFRLLLSSCAYVLMETIRRIGLRGTEMARAQVGTLRLKLLKIGTVIVRNTRRIRLLFSSAYPYQDVFRQACARLATD